MASRINHRFPHGSGGYKQGELYRFDQPIGKQYTYGHGPETRSDDERKDRQIEHLKMENDILKKYMAIEKELKKK